MVVFGHLWKNLTKSNPPLVKCGSFSYKSNPGFDQKKRFVLGARSSTKLLYIDAEQSICFKQRIKSFPVQ